ncbi:MAG: hypothetical protein NTY77_15985 [Elusimicrobia bacterium]|nr:hypothetical protein [Elusimicrobiota bacterium]
MLQNYLRRVVCLPPIGESGLEAGRPEPHTLRQALYPLVLLYTAAYLGLELREFWSSTGSRFLSPEMYTGLLAAYAGDHELRRWTGRADRYALAAESVIYAWWLAFLAMLLWVNLRCGCTRVMPGDMAAICKQVIVVFFGAGVSRYFHLKEGGREKAA